MIQMALILLVTMVTANCLCQRMQSKMFLTKFRKTHQLWFSYRLPLESNNNKNVKVSVGGGGGGGRWFSPPPSCLDRVKLNLCNCFPQRSYLSEMSIDHLYLVAANIKLIKEFDYYVVVWLSQWFNPNLNPWQVLRTTIESGLPRRVPW